jgi:hypothetical protein
VLGVWWDFSKGRSGCGSFSFSRFAGVGICFSFLSLVLFLWVCFVVALANLLYRVVGCYIIYSGANACFEEEASFGRTPKYSF